MQKWEYLQIFLHRNSFSVVSSQGEHFTAKYYQSIDPTGSVGKDAHWVSGVDFTQFLAIILDRLGAEGWEVVGNIEGGFYQSSDILLKRPRE